MPEDVWRNRHRFLLGLTWFHAVIIALAGSVLGYSGELSLGALFREDTVIHTVGAGLIVAFLAALARWEGISRAFQATAVGFGLMSSSAILVHLSGGYIEFHFHFFVMLAFLALYQDWIPYILAIVYVVIHHGVVGAVWPEEVYNHPAAFNAPWTWAGIHAFFVLWASVGSIIAWRFNEIASARTNLILESAGEGIFGLDREGKVTFVNAAAAKMLGLDARESVGKQIGHVVRHTKADGTPFLGDASPILTPLKDGIPRHGADELFCRRDGTSFPVEYLSTPIFDRGQLKGVVATFEDTTERKRAEDALRESEERFRNLVQELDAIVWEADAATWKFIFVSQRAEAILGYPTEKWLREPDFWINHIHPDDREQAVAFCRDSTLEGRDHEFEYRSVAADGRIVWLRDIVRVIRDAEGRVRHLRGLMVDITERKRSEETLREINDTLEAVIQASPMGITILDSDGNVKLWNPAAERMLGWRQEEVLGRLLPSIPPDKREEHRSFRERVLRGEAFSDVEIVRQKKDGSLIDISLSTAPLRDAKGHIWGAMGIMADITERKQAEKIRHALYRTGLEIQEPLELQERLDRLLRTAQTVLDMDRASILLADPEERELQAVASLGVEEPLGTIRVPIGLAGGGLAQAYRTQQAIIWDGHAPLPESLRLRPPYDQIKSLRSRAFAIVSLGVQGRAIGVLGADRKHTRRPLDAATLEFLQLFAVQAAIAIENSRLYERQRLAAIQLEARVEDRTRELQATNARLQETTRHAEAASRHKSAFLANMSHELRTPLNSILGFSQLLQDPTFGPLAAKQTRYLDNIHRSGQHLLALINDLLDLSKVEAGKIELRPEAFELRKALTAVLSEIRPQAETKALMLELQAKDAPSTLTADPIRFKQILLNLLSNAVKFTPDGGSVTVTARRRSGGEGLGSSESSFLDPPPYTLYPGKFVEISVADTGIGIKTEDLPKLFQPFTQLESPFTKEHQGTGLGLALTKQLVELHGGQIFAASDGGGRGSIFTVRLPLGPSWSCGENNDSRTDPGGRGSPAEPGADGRSPGGGGLYRPPGRRRPRTARPGEG